MENSGAALRPLIAPRPRPLSLWHFANPRHWTLSSACQALEQGTHTLLDEAVGAFFALQRTRRSDDYLRSIRADMWEGLALYQRLGWTEDPSLAHVDQVAPDPDTVTREHRDHPTGRYEHLTFPSAYQPHPEDPSGVRWQALTENRQVHAYVLQHHDRPRPWVVNIHGAGMGHVTSDFFAFRTRKLFDQGVNVIHPVLPLHGPRRSTTERAHYPSESMMHNVHGALQGTADVRRAIAWVRELQPGQPIGVHGISLGGFTAALVGSLEADLACAILGVAPADLVLLLEAHHGRGSGYDERVQNFEVGHHLSHMLTPLKLTPALPRDRRYMYAGIVDQLIDYADNISPMIAHWDYPEVLVFDGGHVGVSLNREVPRFVDRALRSSGILPSH